jgi:hypothetical protein
MMIRKEFGNKIGIGFVIAVGLSLVILGIAILSSKWVDNLFLSIISFWKGKPPAPHWLDTLRLIGGEVLLLGVVTVAIAWLALQRPSLVVSLSQNHFVILIWLLIAAKVVSFHHIPNEVDTLPSAKQFVDHNWLPNDWYLNLHIAYRLAFNLTFGPLVRWLGFQYGSYVGRLLIYLLFAVAIHAFFRAFSLRFWLGPLLLFFFLNHQSLVADEWMVGGVDTKTIAYASVLLSCSTFFRKRYLLGFAFAGAAISFHVLIGLYAMFCMAVAILLNRAWRSEWRICIRRCWPIFITGILGLRAIIIQLLPQGAVDVTKAWEFYVKYRVPQHVLPAAWSGGYTWIVVLALATYLFLAFYFFRQTPAARFIAAYALGCVSLFLFGLVIYAVGEIPLLRYYWFRFPDVMVPFMSAVLVALLLSDFSDGRLTIPSLSRSLQSKARLILNREGPILITVAIIILIIAQQMYELGTEYTDFKYANIEKARRHVFGWVAKNTPREAVFLVDPTSANFYIYAQRAMFVSFKHSPQSAAEILEWHKRIELCNGNRFLYKTGFESEKELQTNFYNLDEDQIRQIANSYGINYYLGSSKQRLPFEHAYSNSYFTIYKVNETGKAKNYP